MSATLSSISKYRARLSGQVGRRATTVNVSSLRETAVLGSGKGIRRSLHDSTSTSNLPQVLDLLERYRGLVALGQINYDEEQVRVVMQLRRLQKELTDYAPPVVLLRLTRPRTGQEEEPTDDSPWWTYSRSEESVSESKALVRVRGQAEELAALDTPKGLLLTGPPGSGKSFLIDMWFASLPTRYKVRKHYSQLVLEIYRAVWEETQRRMATVSRSTEPAESPKVPWNRTIRENWRALVQSGSLPSTWARCPTYPSGMSATSDPTIAFVIARRLILNHWLLVFDEVQLLDVSSANLLADVLSWFWRMGGVIVGTSNKVPEDLYKNGVQRERLEPFVAALKARCPVVSMQSTQDWRIVKGGDGVGRTWFKADQQTLFEAQLMSAVQSGLKPQPATLRVFGRPLYIPWSLDGVCKFEFAKICHESIGPADYLTLSSHYHTVAITDIPVMKLADKNQARRFISLIDALYEARCRIICLAKCDPEDLFFPDASSSGAIDGANLDVMMAEAIAETQDVYRPNVSSYDALSMTEAPEVPASLPLDTLSIFSGQDEQFAFKRALSRLIEMTSAEYGKTEKWTPLPPSLRRWEEKSLPTTTSSPLSPLTTPRLDRIVTEEDFAVEASYVGASTSSQVERPDAPRLAQTHVWGVRDD